MSNPATKNPLFLLVALEELRGFGSYEQLEKRIAAFPREGDDTVAALFTQVIERLGEDFQPDVVCTILALLACSRSGLSQRELQELVEGIGADESTGDLFPVLHQLRPYLQDRGELLDFFHRGLYKAVRARYLSTERDLEACHGELAEYFHVRLNPPGSDPWSNEYPRSLSELPYHQTQGKLWEQLETTLTELPFLEAKTQAGHVFELARDFTGAVDALPEDRPMRSVLRLLEKALRRDIHFIARHAEDYPQGLFQCLWNTCWWYDCDEAEAHYVEPEGGWTEKNAPWMRADGERLSLLLERWKATRRQFSGDFPWLRSHRPPPIHLDTPQTAILHGHQGVVSDVSYSPDSRYIATCSSDETVRLWDASTGAELAVLRGHKARATSVSFDPTGTRIISGCADGTGRIWDAKSHSELAVLHGFGGLNCLAYSPDGRRIVAAACNWEIRVWDAQNRTKWTVIRRDKVNIESVSYSPDGQKLVSGCTDGTIRVWDAENHEQLNVLRGHQGEVTAVLYTPDGSFIISGSRDSTVRIWDASSGTEMAALHGHATWVTSVSCSPDGRRVASGSADKTVRVWDLQAFGELAGVLRGHDDRVTSVSFSADGRWIVSGSYDMTARVWDTENFTDPPDRRGHEYEVRNVTCSPNGRQIVSCASDSAARVWDAKSGVEIAILRGYSNPLYSNGPPTYWDRVFRRLIPFLHFLAKRCLGDAVSRRIGGSRRWGTFLRDNAHHITITVVSAAYSPDGQRIIIGSGEHFYRDITVRIWDAVHYTEIAVLRGHTAYISTVLYSPDGRRIVSGSADKTVRVWDATNFTELAVLCGHESLITRVFFSADGRRIISRDSDRKVRVWDADTFECIEPSYPFSDYRASLAATDPVTSPWQPVGRDGVLAIKTTDTSDPIARIPLACNTIVDNPNGRAWAIVSGGHLYIVSLEGESNTGQ